MLQLYFRTVQGHMIITHCNVCSVLNNMGCVAVRCNMITKIIKTNMIYECEEINIY